MSERLRPPRPNGTRAATAMPRDPPPPPDDQPPDLAEVLGDLVRELRRSRRIELAELLAAVDAAAIAGVSVATWHRLHAAAKTPREVRLGTLVRWKRSEVVAWCAAGCPDRKTWEARKAAERRNP